LSFTFVLVVVSNYLLNKQNFQVVCHDVFVFLMLLQVWDIGGQPRFRSMWERYCRGVNAIVYVLSAFVSSNNNISH